MKTGIGLAVVGTLVFGLFLNSVAGQLHVGALTPLTGAGQAYGPGMLSAIKIAADEINAGGGILGKSVVICSEDTQSNPQAAIQAANRLINVQRVCAILGTWSSGVTMCVLPLTTRAGIIEMNVSGAPAISLIGKKTGLVFRTEASNTLYGRVFAEIARRQNFRTAATMAFNNPSGRGNTEEFVRNFKAGGGLITGGIVYEGGMASYRQELEVILAPRPEVIVLGSYMPDTMTILKQWQQFKQPTRFIAPAWAVNSELLDSVKHEITEGIWTTITIANKASKTYLQFVEKYKKAVGQDPEENPYAPKVYDQMILLALAAEAAGSTDPQVIKTKMMAVSGPPGEIVHNFSQGLARLKKGQPIDYEGASGAIDFDENGDVLPIFEVYRVVKGQPKPAYTFQPVIKEMDHSIAERK